MRGLSEVVSRLNAMPDVTFAAAKLGLRMVAKSIFDESQSLVPVDRGVLKSSATSTESGSGWTFTITIMYDTDYAVFVHEIARYYHPHGSYKYLEIPFNRHSADLQTVMNIAVGGIL